MAINVNKVYKSVLSILNKEQRGYLTPQEFNNLARQSQLELLDGLFYQYNQFLNIENVNRTNEGYADLAEKIQEQIDVHYKEHTFVESSDYNTTTGVANLPSDVYKILDFTSKSKTVQLEKINKNRLPYLVSSKLTAPSTKFPIYYEAGASGNTVKTIVTNPTSLTGLEIGYIAKPADPRFGYTVDANYGVEIYDANPYVEGGVILGSKSIDIVSTFSNLNTGTFNVTDTSGLQLTITTTSTAVTSITVTAAGSGLSAGDTIIIDSSAIGGGSASITLTLRVQDLYATTTQGSTDFTLHQSQETQLILNILGYAGLIIKDPSIVSGITQLASADAASKSQQ